jgi:hypothetical protein
MGGTMQLRQVLRRKRVVVPLIATVAVALGAGIAFAGIGGGNVYTGCLTNGGTINKVAIGNSPAGTCDGNSTQISWNQEGQQGPQGIQGIQGDQGDQGVFPSVYERSARVNVSGRQDVTAFCSAGDTALSTGYAGAFDSTLGTFNQVEVFSVRTGSSSGTVTFRKLPAGSSPVTVFVRCADTTP